jgi:hypothetical protein
MQLPDVYLAGKDPLHRWGLANRKSVQVEDQVVWVAPVEYVILRKLEYYREGQSEKYLRDIAGILEALDAQINTAWLEEKIVERQLQNEWQTAKRFRE